MNIYLWLFAVGDPFCPSSANAVVGGRSNGNDVMAAISAAIRMGRKLFLFIISYLQHKIVILQGYLTPGSSACAPIVSFLGLPVNSILSWDCQHLHTIVAAKMRKC
jgi:hypothetical protein